MLEHKQESDYVLPEGESCWITVGNTSVYITNKAGISGQQIELYELEHEDEDPLTTIPLEPFQ